MTRQTTTDGNSIWSSVAFEDAFLRDLALGGALWTEVFEEHGWLWDQRRLNPGWTNGPPQE